MASPKEKIPARICWKDLVAHEPLLDEMLAEARAVKNDDPNFCRDNCLCFGTDQRPSLNRRIRDLLSPYRGPHSNSFLSSEEALRLALEIILDALLLCRPHECLLQMKEMEQRFGQ